MIDDWLHTMPGFSWGSRLYISTYFPLMNKKRGWQYSWPILLVPRWNTQPEYWNLGLFFNSPLNVSDDPSPSERDRILIGFDIIVIRWSMMIDLKIINTVFQEREREGNESGHVNGWIALFLGLVIGWFVDVCVWNWKVLVML